MPFCAPIEKALFTLSKFGQQQLKYYPLNTFSAQKWWSYAISVHLQPISDKNKVYTWAFALERAHDIASYSKVYQEFLNKTDLTAESKALKGDLEKKLNLDLILLLRELVTRRLERKNSIEVSYFLS
nr:vacuolar protein sorting-associated protein 13D-like [Parasteatoda tepidariorum]